MATKILGAKRRPATHREPADENAATELVMYIENTSDLSPDGPSGQGRSVLLNALRKWRKGTYDPTQAVRLFEYLTEAGAKRYAKEFATEREWSTMFTPATRHEAAKQLEASFRNSVENGEYDHIDTRIGTREGVNEARRQPQTPRVDPRAVAFFRKHAGSVIGREEENARALAHAEQEATARGWNVEWSHDPEGWDSLGDIDPETVKEVLSAVLRDENGGVLASLGSIVDPDRAYGRVVEAELALEALSEQRGSAGAREPVGQLYARAHRSPRRR